MKRIILLTLLIPVLAHAQRYGHTSGSTFYWNKSGEAQKSDSIRYIQGSNITLTQSGNTLTISGAASGSSTRQTWYDADGDSVVIQLSPQFLYYLQAKDGTTRMFHVDSAGNMFSNRLGIGGTTAGQQQRAFLNVIGFGDTLAAFIGDGNRAPGDSSVIVDLAGRLGIKTTINTSYSLTNLNGMLSGWYDANIGSSGNANTLISLQNSGSGAGTGAAINIDGAIVRGIERSSVTDLELVAGTNGKVSLVPGSAGGLMFSRSAPTQSLQAFLTVRTAAIDDTLFMVRNDKNSTLDSTMMVFANGSILRRDTKPLPAGSWLATASNGAALSSSNYIPTYAFDTATAETLTVDFALPPNFIQISNVEIEVISPNTDGDSVGFAVAWLGRAADEAFNVAFSSPLSGQIDLGTTANVRKILTISGTFSNLAASDRIIFKLWRDPSVDNDVATDVHFVEMRVNGNGLLY